MMYPHSPGFAANSDTSREAADRLTSKDELQGFILNYLQHGCIYTGSTVDEAKERCESHFERTFDRSTIAARFTELTEEGLIVLTAEKRLTPRRRKAGVYLHRDFAPVGSLERQARGSAKELQRRVTTLELKLEGLKTLTAAQAEDDGLWFQAATAPEAYLQQELRRLHAAIEGV
jgi:hypothetical protein